MLTLVPGERVGAGEATEQHAEVRRAGEELLLELDEAGEVEEERVVARAGEDLAAADDGSDARGAACRPVVVPRGHVVPVQASTRAAAPVARLMV